VGDVEAAFEREVLEELDIEVAVGEFVCVFETVAPYSIQDLDLVFQAIPAAQLPAERLTFVDPVEAAGEVFPPVLAAVARQLSSAAGQPRWLGNVWDASLSSR
jgi:8-oxo-dGTP pyrophosphatase MutT (NUDIX family)